MSFLSESWLDQTFDDSNLTMSGQHQVDPRRDSQKGNHGRLLVLRKTSYALNCKAVNPAPQDDKLCGISLFVQNCNFLCSFFHLPNQKSAFEVNRDALGSVPHSLWTALEQFL